MVSRLVDFSNIGKAIADDLQLIGIDHPGKLIGKDSFKLYEKLCIASGKIHDPCIIDVFISAVHFMKVESRFPGGHLPLNRKKHMEKPKKRENKLMNYQRDYFSKISRLYNHS